MYENLISDVCEDLKNDLKYINVKRVRVNPHLYHELSYIVDQFSFEINTEIFLIEDPSVDTYVIE